MPCLRIETNVSKAAIDLDGFSQELTKALAETLGKPVSYCMVVIVPDVHLTMGAGADASKPAANASLMSIGRLGLAENKKQLYPIFTKYLGVEGTRCYLEFHDAETKNLGYDGTTFHEIMG